MALALIAVTRQAAASDQLQGVFEAAVGYTDNVRSVPEDPPPDTPPKVGAFMLIASPGAVYARATSRQTHRLSYTLLANVFLGHPEINAFINRVDWLGSFDASPKTDILLGAGITQTQTHTDNSGLDTARTTLRATLPGTSPFVVGHATESVDYRPSPDWQLYQSGGTATRLNVVDREAPSAVNASGRLGIERTWRSDALGPALRADYSRLWNSLIPGELGASTRDYWVLATTLRWRSDWGRRFVSRVEGGALVVTQPAVDSTHLFATGAASIAYAPPRGDADLGYERTVQTNLVLGQTLLIDQVTLRGSIPLDGEETLWLSVSSGYQRGRLFDAEGNLTTPVNVLLGGLGIGWQARDQLRVMASYQYFRQDTDAEVRPLPLSFSRNTVLLGARFTIPADEDLPPTHRVPQRVDRTDVMQFTDDDDPTSPAQIR